MAKLRIAVLFGGASKDHAVSLKSAHSVLTALSKNKYEIIPVGITKVGRWLYYPGNYDAILDGTWENDSDCCPAVLSPDAIQHGILKLLDDGSAALQRVDVIFSVLHGKYGEGGRIQGLCKLSGIPFVGSNPEASNACLDKMLTHLLLDKANIKTIPYHYFERSDLPVINDRIAEMEQILTYPVFVKAASCSSSIGASIAFNRDDLTAGLKIAFSHHHKALVEKAIIGRDAYCIVYEDERKTKVSVIGETITTKESMENGGKYIAKTGQFRFPAQLSKEQSDCIHDTAVKAFSVMGCNGFARIDFLVTDKAVYCKRIAVMPGFTEECIFSQLMNASGFEFEQLLDMLIFNAYDHG